MKICLQRKLWSHGLIGLLFAFTYGPATRADQFKLKIIAFNDFHGNLESPGKFRADARSPSVPVGGADALAGYVEFLKAQNPFHVVVAAGDLVGASPMVSALFHDEGTIEAMNLLGLEISSVGNHEFDKGKRELLREQQGGCSTEDENTCKGAQTGTPVPFEGAQFQYLAANVFDQATGKTIFPAYSIETYNSVLVAFIGLTLRGTPAEVTPNAVAGLRFDDVASTINSVVRQLRTEGVKTFVVLIHQGGLQATKGIVDINACAGGLAGYPIKPIVNRLDDAVDLVISAHTHAAYVCQISNGAGREIPVTSASSYGRVLTDIDVTLDTSTKKAIGVTARNMLVDRTNPKIPPDPAVKTLVERYAALAAPLTNRVEGAITGDITKTTNAAGESPLGDLVADAQLEATRDSGGAVMAFMNSTGIRPDVTYSSAPGSGGKVTYGEISAIQPFGNILLTMSLTGTQIKTLLEQQFKGCTLDFPPAEPAGQSSEEILQVSHGFTYRWNPAGGLCKKVDAASMKLNGIPLVPSRKYRVTANNFLADGGSGMHEFTRGTNRVGGPLDIEALASYFEKHPQISPSSMGRIQTSQPKR